MKRLKRNRQCAVTWVTLSKNNLASLLASAEETSSTYVKKLESAIQALQLKLCELDSAQSEFEGEAPDAEFEESIVESSQLKLEAEEVIIRAQVRLSEIAGPASLVAGPTSQVEDRQEISSIVGSLNSGSTKVKLPKLEIAKFSGNILEWQTFWDLYLTNIHDSDLADVNKFSYLRCYLEGEARAVISGLSTSSENYHKAIALLEERYNRPERIVFTHLQSLLRLSTPVKSRGSSYVKSLWTLRDEILSHTRSLEALGIAGSQCEVFLTPIILSRLPTELTLEWARDSKGHEADLDHLLEFLKNEIERLERSESLKDFSSDYSKSKSTVTSPSKPKHSSYSASSLASASSVQCNFCRRKGHYTDKCNDLWKLSGEERYEALLKSDLCFKCLSRSHLAKDCSVIDKKPCVRCRGKHNILLCGIKVSKLSSGSEDHRKEDSSKTGSSSRSSPSPSLSPSPSPNSPSSTSPSPPSENGSSRHHSSVSACNLSSRVDNCTVLQTARVNVMQCDNKVSSRWFFDLGADRTYISSSLVKKINPEFVGTDLVPYSAFGGHKSQSDEIRSLFKVKFLDVNGDSHSLVATEIPVICQPLIRPSVPSSVLSSFAHLKLADTHDNKEPLVIDILVGNDLYWELISPMNAIKVNSIVAHNSWFGWLLSGSWQPTESSPTLKMKSTQFLCVSSVCDSDVSKFWDLETVGISPKEVKSENSLVLEKFNESIQFVDERYEVQLPWKLDSRSKLMNNESLALKAVDRLYSRLDKNPELYDSYHSVFEEYKNLGIIEEIPLHDIVNQNPIYYMIHFPVIKEFSSTKIRPVFNCSASSYNGISLNDCLESGPSLNPDLCEIILRYRRYPIAVSSDITKAFLQISVVEEDRDVHRFLLKNGNDIKHYRFRRVPFGNTSSPFILNATIKHHLENYPSNPVVDELKVDTYVDNFLTGANTVTEALSKYSEAHSIMSKANMDLTKVVSNSQVITDIYGSNTFEFKNGELSILGLNWNPVEDVFKFNPIELHSDVNVTKRVVLSVLAKIFDPIGYLSPYVMYGKLLFQDIWKEGLNWDSELPDEFKNRFMNWIESSKHFESFSLPRCYFPQAYWPSENVEIVAFGDASTKGYGSVVYLRRKLENGDYDCQIVMSKSRVAPLKKITLPRLELLASLLCARLVAYVMNALKLSKNTKITCFTDSTITLAWIQSDANCRKLFVANRVLEIQSLTPPSCWRHCSSESNPADLISRGVLADQLVSNSLWLHGPENLSELIENDKIEKYNTQEESKPSVACLVVQNDNHKIDISKYSLLSKVIRIYAYAMRFIKKVRSKEVKITGKPSLEELEVSKFALIKCMQQEHFQDEIQKLSSNEPLSKKSVLHKLDPFIDEKGILRIKGRLEYAELSYDCKHPIILPSCHLSRLLVKFQHFFLNHAGVNTMISSMRQQFYIFKLRKLCKTVVKECNSCKRHDGQVCRQPVAPLPELRIKSAPPFTVTGIDFAGPIYAADQPSKKLYILLFTCAVIRAVHIELTNSMSVEDCMLAIRRFTARRGIPSYIYSDNAKTFKAVVNVLPSVYGHHAPIWKFICPISPWWGGFYERLIKSVKMSLKKTIGVKFLSRVELETVLFEIESCINSRPLTYISDDTDSSEILTPAHFLLCKDGKSKIDVTSEVPDMTSVDLRDKLVVKNQMIDKFWKLWTEQYLVNLPHVVKGFHSKCSLDIGSIVLVKTDNLPRQKWPLGIVIEVFPGKDGLIRSVKVKTANSVVVRPIQRLIDLEISNKMDCEKVSDQYDVVDDLDCSSKNDEIDTRDIHSNVCVTRRGRVVKPPQRFR